MIEVDGSKVVKVVAERKRLNSTSVAILAFSAGALLAGGIVLSLDNTTLENGVQSYSQGVNQLNTSLATACERLDPINLPIDVQQDCTRAKQGEKPPVVANADVPPSIVAVNPEDVRRQVNDYFRDNPIQGGPSIAQVLELVNRVYNDNPPLAGPPVSVEQRAADVAAYCANNRCQGEQGDPGQNQPPVSDERIFAQVAKYCEDDACTGPKGDQGIPGIQGVQGVPGAPGRGELNRDYDIGATPPVFWDAEPPPEETQCYEYSLYNLEPLYVYIPVNNLLCTS